MLACDDGRCGVLRQLLLHRSEGLPVDDGRVLAGIACSLVADLAGVERVREQLVEMAAGEGLRRAMPFAE